MPSTVCLHVNCLDLCHGCLQDADTEAAPLFGRGDHAAQDKALSVRDKCDLVIRASFLITVFLPFLILGPFLLLLANQFAPSNAGQAQAASLAAGSSAHSAADQQVGHALHGKPWQQVAQFVRVQYEYMAACSLTPDAMRDLTRTGQENQAVVRALVLLACLCQVPQ